MDDRVTTAVRAAEKAAEVQRRGTPKEFTEKRDRDPVTGIDRECEKVVRDTVKDRFPEDAFLGEESGGSTDTYGYSWIVDPVDGTANYLHGLPHYTSSVAVLKNGTPEIGVVHHSPTDDVYTAVKGEGARHNGDRINVTDKDLQDSLIATGFHPEASTDHYLTVKSLVESTQGVRRLAAASFDLCMVAEGTVDGFYEPHLNPWDIAAGVLIVEEAGGTVTDFHSNGEWSSVEEGEVVASNGRIHKELLELSSG
ncbi:MAG: inositol monophosphatase [Halobacteria archaeon]